MDRQRRISRQNRRATHKALKKTPKPRQDQPPPPSRLEAPRFGVPRMTSPAFQPAQAAARDVTEQTSVSFEQRMLVTLERGFFRFDARLAELASILRYSSGLEEPLDKIADLQTQVGELQSQLAEAMAEKQELQELMRSGSSTGDVEFVDPALYPDPMPPESESLPSVPVSSVPPVAAQMAGVDAGESTTDPTSA